MGFPAIFNGTLVKLLKGAINLNDAAYILTGTADPTSVAQNAPAGSLYLNTSTGKHYKKTDAGSTVNWLELMSAPVSSVTVFTPNGHGSTNNKIRIYSGSATTVGSDITYATSAANGDTFTINTTGAYWISVWDFNTSTSQNIGISVNSAQLTTAIQTITAANRLALCGTLVNANTQCSVTAQLTANDVIRAHDTGSLDSTSNVSGLKIIRVL